MKKKIVITLIIIALVIIAAGVYFSLKVREFESYIENIEIKSIDLSKIGDGVYSGISDSGVVKVSLEVYVENHEITDIKLLEHVNGKGQEADKILDRIVESQNNKVDIVTGATYSSKVMMDAVQKALESAI